jgi:hypothetical protein
MWTNIFSPWPHVPLYPPIPMVFYPRAINLPERIDFLEPAFGQYIPEDRGTLLWRVEGMYAGRSYCSGHYNIPGVPGETIPGNLLFKDKGQNSPVLLQSAKFLEQSAA